MTFVTVRKVFEYGASLCRMKVRENWTYHFIVSWRWWNTIQHSNIQQCRGLNWIDGLHFLWLTYFRPNWWNTTGQHKALVTCCKISTHKISQLLLCSRTPSSSSLPHYPRNIQPAFSSVSKKRAVTNQRRPADQSAAYFSVLCWLRDVHVLNACSAPWLRARMFVATPYSKTAYLRNIGKRTVTDLRHTPHGPLITCGQIQKHTKSHG